MSTQIVTNKAIVQRVYDEIWNQGKLDVADEVFAKPDNVKRYISDFRQAFPDIQHTPIATIAENDTVIAHWTANGTHTGPWHSLAPTNQQIEYQGVTMARLEDGKIVEHNTVWDSLQVLEQLNAVPKIRKPDGSRL